MTTLPLDVTTTPAAPAEIASASGVRARVARLREVRLVGTTLALVPYSTEHAEPLRTLRNLPENQFNLAQGGEISAEQQAGWARAYSARDNDLCWAVVTPQGEFAGATRIYDIDLAGASAEKGGLVLRSELARVAPLALEAELMLLHLAFRWLGLAEIITQVRPENTNMLSINARLGFQPAGEATLRGVAYGRFSLTAGGFDPAPLLPILRHWKSRHAR